MSRPHSFALLLAVCFTATSSNVMAQLNPYPAPAPIPGAGGVTAPGRLANRVPLPTPVPDPGVFKAPVTVPPPAPPATNPAVAPRTASPAPFAKAPGPVANIPAPRTFNAPAPHVAGGVGCGTGGAGCGSGGCATGGCATGGCATGGCGGHSGSCGKSCTYYPLFSDMEPFGCGSGTGGGMLSRYFKSVFGARTNFCGDSGRQGRGSFAGCGSAGCGSTGSGCGGGGCSLTGSNGCGLFGNSCGNSGLSSCLNGSMFGNCGSGGMLGNCSLGGNGCGIGGLGGCRGKGLSLAGKGLFGNCGPGGCPGGGGLGGGGCLSGLAGGGLGGGGLGGSCLSGLAGGSGGACGFASLGGKLAYPDAGWAPPASVPIIRNNAQYTNWWPEQWYGSPGFNAVPHPMVFMPTDTTQLGFGYMQVPMWQRTTANYPPIPDAAQYHTRTAPIPSPYGYPKVYQPVAIPHHAGVRNRTGWHASASKPQSKEQYVAMQRARQYQARQAEQARRQYQAMRYRQAQMYQASQQRSAANIRPVSSSSPR